MKFRKRDGVVGEVQVVKTTSTNTHEKLIPKKGGKSPLKSRRVSREIEIQKAEKAEICSTLVEKYLPSTII